MYNISSTLVRSGFLWLKIKKILNEKWITVTELAEKSWITRPSLTNVLNWKKSWSDDLFRTAMEAIPLTETEIKKIFQEADKEEYKYKYWEDLWLDTLVIKDEGQEIVTTKEEAESVLFKKNWIDKPTDEDLLAIRIALDMAKKRREMKK